jgi:hypothetical protein
MPAAGKWVSHAPPLDVLPADDLWRVHLNAYRGDLPNPNAKGRLAMPGKYAALYAADTLSAALWEAVLRSVRAIKGTRNVRFPADKLNGLVATRVTPPNSRAMLDLRRPAVLRMIPNPTGRAMKRLQGVLTTPKHDTTHSVAVELEDELNACGITPMPALCWPSLQAFPGSVYLDYVPLGAPSGWSVVDASIALDDAQGHELVREELKARGFRWIDLS